MTSIPTVPSVLFTLMSTPKLRKDWHAALNGCKRIKPIKRTRKRAIQRAAFMDHTGYERSQWWHKKARKPRRHKHERI